MSIVKEELSESTNGKPIVVSNASTNIHAWSSGVESVTLYANNVTADDKWITVAVGAVATVGEQILHEFVVTANSTKVLITPDETLTGTVTITAIGETASAVNITGSVIRRS